MIYSVNLNSSLDYIMRVSSFKTGETNRTESDGLRAGGKGVNVAAVVRNFGIPCKAFVFVAGFVGDEIVRQLTDSGLDCEFIRTEGNSRINVKLKSEEETEINGRGRPLKDEEIFGLADRLKIVGRDDILVLSGNAPGGTREDVYRLLAENANGARVVVDAWGSQLRCALKAGPFLVKPNLDELSDYFGKRLAAADAPEYAVKLRSEGARNVLVSLGGEGGVLAAENGRVYVASAPAGNLVNSTGAGDSAVAGFVTAFTETGSFEKALAFAVASGSACAFADGFPGRNDAENLLKKIVVRSA